ncbi:hypothetical protein CcCBS67573_g08571 [Chytriomyces confervae]|uniref:CHCH domain-containing protein n=1 Tax=Chytriomyces confervae TaxID=246404 RepID=A0A507EKB7_9FUNG|nr:hypothetical protein BJ741DRAFT_594674 [Chytriomyces cf. hyalinus JEL632]KAJ3409357.1 hypothetical protein HDU80_001376 [Chytriomyces hyalinus]TPX63835.1 hypothetical protein CcCBS67573_g08571 [Chytriomyces confervae]
MTSNQGSVNVLIHDSSAEESDEYNLRIQRTGCFAQHNRMLDCHFSTKDWRKCTVEMKLFKECFEKHQQERQQRSISDRALESVKVDRDASAASRAAREPSLCEMPPPKE